MNKYKKYLPLVIVALIAGGAGFWGGDMYAASKKPANTVAAQDAGGNNFRGGAGGRQGGRNGGAFAGGGFTSGQILSKDDKSLTIKMRDGGSKIVFLAASTTAFKPAPLPVDSLVVGDDVMVMGKANDDGSVTASSIQVRSPMPPNGAPVVPPKQ